MREKRKKHEKKSSRKPPKTEPTCDPTPSLASLATIIHQNSSFLVQNKFQGKTLNSFFLIIFSFFYPSFLHGGYYSPKFYFICIDFQIVLDLFYKTLMSPFYICIRLKKIYFQKSATFHSFNFFMFLLFYFIFNGF